MLYPCQPCYLWFTVLRCNRETRGHLRPRHPGLTRAIRYTARVHVRAIPRTSGPDASWHLKRFVFHAIRPASKRVLHDLDDRFHPFNANVRSSFRALFDVNLAEICSQRIPGLISQRPDKQTNVRDIVVVVDAARDKSIEQRTNRVSLYNHGAKCRVFLSKTPVRSSGKAKGMNFNGDLNLCSRMPGVIKFTKRADCAQHGGIN